MNMKKSVLKIAAAAALSVAFSSVFSACSSSSLSISDCGPIAVVSVIGNKSVPWFDSDVNEEEDGDPNGILSTSVNRLFSKDNIEFTSCESRIDYADEAIRDGLVDLAGVEVVDKETVVNSEVYEDISKSYYNVLFSTVEADGYKDLTTLGSKNARILMDAVGAKSLLLFEFDFRKEIVSGSKWDGEVGSYIKMTVRMKDERGRESIYRVYEVRSANTVRIDSLKYDKSALVELIKPTIDSAVSRFIVDYIN